MHTSERAGPTILFGAFDRHNLGDLLFPHIATRLLGGTNLLYAGVAERDLSGAGGGPVRSIAQLAKELNERPVNILHAGGELLTCDAWQAAVMVQSIQQIQPILRRFEAKNAQERMAWANGVLAVADQAPYVVARELFPGVVRILYTAVGGVELSERDKPFRTEVISKLRDADYLSVRDRQTRAYLSENGIYSHLVPDPAVTVRELFAEQIEQRARTGEVAAIQAAIPQGYIAFQYSADFGVDTILREMAAQLDHVATATGLGVVLFRAGAAPWHDDLESYQRLTGFIRSAPVRIFSSLNIWDICALIARCRVFCGSSLHGRIVAMAFGVPRVNLIHPSIESRTGKQAAYASTWELPGVPSVIGVTEITQGALHALASDPEQLQIHAGVLAGKYLDEFTTILTLLDEPMG